MRFTVTERIWSRALSQFGVDLRCGPLTISWHLCPNICAQSVIGRDLGKNFKNFSHCSECRLVSRRNFGPNLRNSERFRTATFSASGKFMKGILRNYKRRKIKRFEFALIDINSWKRHYNFWFSHNFGNKNQSLYFFKYDWEKIELRSYIGKITRNIISE